MDLGVPAPKKDEKFYPVSNETLVPKAIAPLYQDLMQYSASQPKTDRRYVQDIVWKIRDTALGKYSNTENLSLSTSQKNILNKASPNGLEKLLQYHQRKSQSDQRKRQIKKSVDDVLGTRTSSHRTPHHTVSNKSILDSVNEILVDIRNLPVREPLKENNAEFTFLQKGIWHG